MRTVYLSHEFNINDQLKKLVPQQVLETVGSLTFSITAWDEETEEFLGYLIYSSHKSKLKRTMLDYIYVFEEYRNQKVGTNLVNAMIDSVRSIGIKEIEVNLLDAVGQFEDSLNFFLDSGFIINSKERAFITYCRDEIINNSLLKDSIDKYSCLSDVKGVRTYSDHDRREHFKLELGMGYDNLASLAREGDLSFCLYERDKMVMMALGTITENHLFYYVFDALDEAINKTILAKMLIATGVAIKNKPEIDKITFTIEDEEVFQSFMMVCGESDDFVCSQRLVLQL